MIKSPYDALGAPREEDGQRIDGAFECENCFKVVDHARYLPKDRIITWKCPDGHINLVEDYDLD